MTRVNAHDKTYVPIRIFGNAYQNHKRAALEVLGEKYDNVLHVTKIDEDNWRFSTDWTNETLVKEVMES